MAIYSVYAASADKDALAKARFFKDGFSWPAFVFAQLWLLFHRQWLWFVVWMGVEIAFFVIAFQHLPLAITIAVDLLARLLLGLEGNHLRAAKAARKAGFGDVVAARDRDEAEMLFYRRHWPETDA